MDARAREITANCFPECAEHILGVHILRWQEGIARFPTGRLRQMTSLRKEMTKWDLPIQLCGDYLDGISSEGALVTGEEAARNVMEYLGRQPVTADAPSESLLACSNLRG